MVKINTENLYEVSELHEYSYAGAVGGQDIPLKKQEKTSIATCIWKASIPFLLALLVVVLVLILILQSIAVYDLRINPSVCSMSTTTSSTSGSLTGGTGTCDCGNNTELLNQINEVLTWTKDVLSFNNMQTEYIQNSSETIHSSFETVQESALRLTDIIGTLSNIKDNSITTEGIVNDVLLIVEEVLKIQNSSQSLSSLQPKSCQDVKNNQPNSPSGYYHINNAIVYCEMGELCGSEGGWSQLAYLDMSDSTVDCPTGFRLYEVDGIRACGRPSGGASCASVKFPSNGISYSEVCGRVVGYQYASPDAVDTRFVGPEIYNDINTYYFDGVSITQNFPRKHIWTLMGGVSDSIPDAGNCPCNSPPGSTQFIRPFIGNDYFCESGNPSSWTYKLYTADPLWDGEGCGTQEGNCCTAPGLPWFHRTLNSTTDYLELRVCGDEITTYDDVPVGLYEIYVK